MATFGGLGGLGGLGSSFPTRYGAPESEAVGYLPDASSWMTDWQSRYDAEAAKRGQGAGANREQFLNNELSKWGGGGVLTWDPGKDVPAFADHFMGGDSYSTAGRETEEDVFRQMMGGDLYDKLANYQPSAGYRPNFSALNAEKEQMTPQFAAQTRNQQAFDNMQGNGQENGVIGAGYTAPNFGQVNGDFGQGDMGAPANATSGLDMSWTDGKFNQQAPNSGVYSGGARKNSGWGLW